MSFANELLEKLSTSDITKVNVSDMTEYQRGQYNMLNRVLLEVHRQIIKELT